MKKIIALLMFSALFMNVFAQYERWTTNKALEGEQFGTTPDGKDWYTVRDISDNKKKQKDLGLVVDGKLIIPFGKYFFIKGFTHNGKQYFEASIWNPYDLETDEEHWRSFIDMHLYDQYGKIVNKSFLSMHYWIEKCPHEKYFKISLDEQTMGLIDRNLNIVIPFSLGYSRIDDLGNSDIVSVKKDGLWGLYDVKAKSVIIAPSFDKILRCNQSTRRVEYELNGFLGIMTFTGQEIIPTTRGYTKITYNKALKRYLYEMYGYKGECDYNGRQLSKIKVATPQNNTSNNNTVSTSSASSKNNSNSSTTTTSTPVRQLQPVQVWNPCLTCGGTGMCIYCQGNGKTWYGNSYENCVICHGNMYCTSCYGKKGYYSIEYK